MKKLSILILSMQISSLGIAQCKLDYSNYQLVLDEQFDTYNGQVSQLFGSSSIWQGTPDDPHGGSGIEYYEPGQVSLIPDGNGGYRARLTAQKLSNSVTFSNGRTVWYKSGILTLKKNPVGSFDPVSSACASGYPFNVHRGYAYGMFEIRCKTPAGDPNAFDTWPAFWLISMEAELDIVDDISGEPNPGRLWNSGMLDWAKQPWVANNPDWVQVPYCTTCPGFNGNFNYSPGDIVSDWGVSYKAVNYTTPMGCGMDATSKLENLSTDFHTYTAVWTPDKITYFFDGREAYTIPASKAHLSTTCPLNIFANLEIRSEAANSTYPEPFAMDIDYIKVYKPKGYPNISERDYSATPFKNIEGWINHKPQDQNSWAMLINEEYGSLVVNPANTNELFYKGTDNRMYHILNSNGSFTNEWISYNVNSTNNEIGGSLTFNTLWGMVVFRGMDNYLHYLNYWNNGTWHDNLFGTTSDYQVSADPGSIACAGNGDIVFKGPDNKLRRVVYNNGISSITLLGDYPSFQTFVKGDIQVGSTTDILFYKGIDNKLQSIWRDPLNNLTHCVYVDNSSTTNFLVSTKPGSVTLRENGSGNELYYIGQDNEIQHFYQGTGWQHEWLPYAYPATDKARGNIIWDKTNRRVLYGGIDGRIQYFGGAPSWYHDHINDYWNTLDYNHYYGTQTGAANLQLANGASDMVYYCDNTGALRYFIWEGCEYENPQCSPNSTKDLNRQALHGITGGEPEQIITSLLAYPNPSVDGMFHMTQTDGEIVTVTDIQGRIVLQKPAAELNGKLDLSLQSNGIYTLELKAGNNTRRQKIVVNK